MRCFSVRHWPCVHGRPQGKNGHLSPPGVVGNWGLRGPALFFVCLFYQLLNDAQNWIGIPHPRALVFPKNSIGIPHHRAPLCFLGPLCLSSSLKAVSKSLYFVGPSIALSACVEVCQKVETFQCLLALVFCHHIATTFSDGLPSCSFQLIALFGLWFTVVCEAPFFVWMHFLKLCVRSQALPRCAFFLSKGVTVWMTKPLCAQPCFISPQSFTQSVSKCL